MSKWPKLSLAALVLIFALIGMVKAFSGPQKQVAGAETENDSNHPTEIYYGPTGVYGLQDMAKDLRIEI